MLPRVVVTLSQPLLLLSLLGTISCHWLLPLSSTQVGIDAAVPDGPRGDASTDVRDMEPDADPSCTTKVVTVVADQDDGEISVHDSLWLRQGEDETAIAAGYKPGIYIGHWLGGPTWAYFRFRLPEALPTGATVLEARLDMYCLDVTDNWVSTAGALVVGLEDAADAPQVESASDDPDSTTGRDFVGPMQRWPETGSLSWPEGSTAQSPNLAPRLQQLVDTQLGLAEGAHLQLWLRGEGYAGDAEVATADVSRDPTNAARLTVRWCD